MNLDETPRLQDLKKSTPIAKPRHKFRPRSWAIQAYRHIVKVKTPHIVVCGIPRSGTTLLYQMIRHCTTARTWPREMSALTPEVINAKGNPVVSKTPRDLLVSKRIQRIYKNIHFIATWRDPREVLASKLHGRYWVEPEDYLICYNEIEKNRNNEKFTIIKFIELIENPEKIEEITRRHGITILHPFREYYKYAPKDEFLGMARPLDRTTLKKWQKPENIERIRKILEEYPILNEIAERYKRYK